MSTETGITRSISGPHTSPKEKARKSVDCHCLRSSLRVLRCCISGSAKGLGRESLSKATNIYTQRHPPKATHGPGELWVRQCLFEIGCD